MSITSPTFDLVVRSHNGQPLAFVEVKNQERLSTDDAKAIRRNLLVHGMPHNAAFFLLVSEDHLFLWKNDSGWDVDSPAALEIDMKPILARYSKGLDRSKRLRGTELELLIQQWLIDLSVNPALELSESEKALESLGFISAAQGSTVTAE